MEFVIKGTVASGLGKGKEFVTLNGYVSQFQDKLGYEPYPGTLNVEVEEPVHRLFEPIAPIEIEGWEDSKRSFGIVHCYPASVVGESDADAVSLHVIIPKRTDHNSSTIELISSVNLRETFKLTDGSVFEVWVESPSLAGE